MFIQVSDGVWVEKDKIEVIESVTQTKSVIYTSSGRTYKVTIPIDALRRIIESKNDGTTEKLLQQILQGQQTQRV